MNKLLILIVVLLGLAGCCMEQSPIAVERTSNKDINLGLLFEKDGCKVYRFADGGHFHYLSICSKAHTDAKVEYSWCERIGRTCVHNQETL